MNRKSVRHLKHSFFTKLSGLLLGASLILTSAHSAEAQMVTAQQLQSATYEQLVSVRNRLFTQLRVLQAYNGENCESAETGSMGNVYTCRVALTYLVGNIRLLNAEIAYRESGY
jgi:hypothetical protein